MQKNYRFSKKQDYGRDTDLKVKFDCSKKHPPYRELKPSLPQLMSVLELDGYGWQWKNLLLFSIIWIDFSWCESRDSFNFMAFSGGFLVVSSTRPFIGTLMFWYIKGVQVTYIWAKFHLCLICSFRVLKFQCFHTSWKYNFMLLQGGFLNVTHWNMVKFV